jgi:hypothetical protein
MADDSITPPVPTPRERVARAVRELGAREVARRVGLRSQEPIFRYLSGAPIQTATEFSITAHLDELAR